MQKPGFCIGEIPQAECYLRIAANVLLRNGFLIAGQSLLFPDIAHRGRRLPGQIRDKFVTTWAWLAALFPALVLTAVIGSQSKPGDQEHIDRIHAELDALHTEYIARLGDHRHYPRGTVYSRFSTRFQESIADQVRAVLEWACHHQIFVPREHLYFDVATSGKKQRRRGMDALRETLSSRQAQCALFFSTSRAFRNRNALSDFVDRAMKKWKCRCVFTSQNIDSSDEKSQLMLGMVGVIDEYFTKASVAHIRSAHIGLLEEAFVFGTETYGYCGEPVEGLTTHRGRAKRKLAIDPVTAAVVVMIFCWFVKDGLTAEEIARRLATMPEYPLPVKASAGWTPGIIRSILRNTRYRGLWSYGATYAEYLREEDYTRQESRESPLHQKIHEHLRIIPDDQWFAAQARLAPYARPSGRPPVAKPRRPRLVEGLLYCPSHNRPLIVSGAHGKFLRCPECRRMLASDRPLFSLVPRQLAERLLLEFLEQAVTHSELLVERLVEACRAVAQAAAELDPNRVKELERRINLLTSRIQYNRGNVGESAEEQADADRTIRELGRERQTAQAELNALRSAAEKRPPTLSRDDVVNRLQSLHTDVVHDHLDRRPDLVIRLRRALELVTGGRVDLEQCGERKEKMGWLTGTFQPHLLDCLLGGSSTSSGSEIHSQVVRIEFKSEPSWVRRAKQVTALIEAGVQPDDAAKQLHIQAASVVKLYHRWYQRRGLPVPPAFSRLSRKPVSEQRPPRYQEIAEQVQKLLDSGWPMQEIARHFEVDRNTITATVKYLAKQRGERVVDGRARRKQLRLQREQEGDSSKNS